MTIIDVLDTKEEAISVALELHRDGVLTEYQYNLFSNAIRLDITKQASRGMLVVVEWRSIGFAYDIHFPDRTISAKDEIEAKEIIKTYTKDFHGYIIWSDRQATKEFF